MKKSRTRSKPAKPALGGRPRAPKGETPAARFIRLANDRTAKAVAAIQALGNLTGRRYESTLPQRNAITETLTQEVNALQAKLENRLTPLFQPTIVHESKRAPAPSPTSTGTR